MPLQTKAKKGTKGNKLFNARKGNNLITNVENLLSKGAVEQVCPQRTNF